VVPELEDDAVVPLVAPDCDPREQRRPRGGRRARDGSGSGPGERVDAAAGRRVVVVALVAVPDDGPPWPVEWSVLPHAATRNATETAKTTDPATRATRRGARTGARVVRVGASRERPDGHSRAPGCERLVGSWSRRIAIRVKADLGEANRIRFRPVRTFEIEAAGATLFGYEWGERGRPALLYWDGLGGTGLHANEIAPILANDHGLRVVAPDPPGHGRSPALAAEAYRP
jgi:hypothetical protein